MILSGREIVRHMGEEIIIDPFDPKKVNPNSYNLTLSDELMVYDNHELDMKRRIPDTSSIYRKKEFFLNQTSSTWEEQENIQRRSALCRCWKEDLLSDGLVSSSTLRQGSAM